MLFQFFDNPTHNQNHSTKINSALTVLTSDEIPVNAFPFDLMEASTEHNNFCICNSSLLKNKSSGVFRASCSLSSSSGELPYKDLYFCFTLLKTSHLLPEALCWQLSHHFERALKSKDFSHPQLFRYPACQLERDVETD